LRSSRQKFQTIDEYIETFPIDIRKILESVRQTIKKAAPDADEVISYQIPTFKLNGNLVHFAAFKKHIGFYPGSKAIKDFQKDLIKYKSSKGVVQFPIDEAMPLSLIQKIVKHRVKENSAKTKKEL
jgi:uncharacterized protein YdhG (YjbR/CyaY superfamily)